MLDFGFYNMDCMEGMKEFPDKYFDLAIVDPPYGDACVEKPPSSGGVQKTDILQMELEKGKVSRVGGTWAAKFGKKLLRGMLRQGKSILTNFSASHAIRLYGVETTLTYHQQDVF